MVSQSAFFCVSQAPARVNLCVTTFLAMSTTMASIQGSLPPVAYTKAVDVWTGMCVFFVFCSLMEYAFVNYAARNGAFHVRPCPEQFPSKLTWPESNTFYSSLMQLFIIFLLSCLTCL